MSPPPRRNRSVIHRKGAGREDASAYPQNHEYHTLHLRSKLASHHDKSNPSIHFPQPPHHPSFPFSFPCKLYIKRPYRFLTGSRPEKKNFLIPVRFRRVEWSGVMQLFHRYIYYNFHCPRLRMRFIFRAGFLRFFEREKEVMSFFVSSLFWGGGEE